MQSLIFLGLYLWAGIKAVSNSKFSVKILNNQKTPQDVSIPVKMLGLTYGILNCPLEVWRPATPKR